MCLHTARVTASGDDDARVLEFRIIDYGHARLAKNKALAKLPKAPGLELSYRKYALSCLIAMP